MGTSYAIDPATKEYLDEVPHRPLSLVIVGQDPFPTGATGIPFSKRCWESQLAESSAGLYVLKILGINTDAARSEFRFPDELFRALRDQGVVLLNASYIPPSERESKGLSWKKLLQASREYDKKVLEQAERVVLCGNIAQRLSKLPYVKNPLHYVHPAPRNRSHPIASVRERWCEQWGGESLRSLWSCDDTTTGGSRLAHCHHRSK